MRKFLMSIAAAVAVMALADSASAGPLRNLACRVRDRVSDARCEVRQVVESRPIATTVQRVAEQKPVRTTIVGTVGAVRNVVGGSCPCGAAK